MLTQYIYWIFLIWAATFIIGLASLPVCRLVFRFSSDKGYAFSKIIGWFSVSYIAFLAVTLKLLPLSVTVLTAAVFLWLALNLLLFIKKPEKIFPGWRAIITTEVIFLLAFSGLLLIKSFQPEIYQIERFMDFGFIETLKNSVSLPVQDIWFAGENLNYYYFGHFIGFTVLNLTGIDTVPGFFLLVALIFALLATAIFRLARDIASNWIAGLLSIFSALITGTWYMVPWILKKMLFLFRGGTDPAFFYPEPTRVIPGTITEMPIYSFLVAELHAHVWGMLSGIAILAILYSCWRDEGAGPNKGNLYFWALAFVLGISYMINSWDAVTLGILSLAVVVLKYWRENKMRLLVFGSSLAIVAYMVAIPWGIFNKAPIKGVGLVASQSPFLPWLSFWGSSLTIVLIYFLWGRKKTQNLFPAIIMSASVFFLILIEIIYVKDILSEGEWYRANTVFKVTIQVWLWISIFAGPVFIWAYGSLKKRLARITCLASLAIYISIGAIYPVIAVSQSSLEGKNFTGIDAGLSWWQQKYPDDREAYLFLRDLKGGLPKQEKLKRIVEAEGDSYTDVSRFSVFLGWPTIIGWPVHEWTWRGSYELVGKRREEVREIYIGADPETSRAILDKYDIDYIIVGQVEKARYPGQIQTAKLRKLGNVIFEKEDDFVVDYRAGKIAGNTLK